jgi:hypothetical protein
MGKTKKIKFFLTKVCAHPFVSAFWQIFATKNNVEWKPCSHVEASLLKFNVIVQVSVHKGSYNFRITTRVKIVSLGPSNHGATCMINLIIHKRSIVWKKNVAIIKTFPNKKNKT